jgi:Asp-tRNA(Asn)/Glu-tRNA(Gln) amidotransferase A subunit family amidase
VTAGGALPTRRAWLAVTAGGLAGSALFGRALAQAAGEAAEVTPEMIRQAEWVSGLELTEAERELMLKGVRELQEQFSALRAVAIDNAVAPAALFQPAELEEQGGPPPDQGPVSATPSETAGPGRPAADDELAFLPLHELAPLLRRREVSATELTRIYLERLERFDPVLEAVITTTTALAREQARQADAEIARGRYRGVLHGIPWGAKDLLAVPGYPTTWGATPFREQVRAEKATVVARLERSGAVLLAKLTLGALAWGDVWFGGQTKNPWNPEQGSSGSSAGSAAATAAGLVAFAIGSETWGSIVSPCTRTGCTGLRPTFGRVSRHGAMALSWTMDKLGPITRSVEDAALVFAAIAGPDGLDPTVVARPFRWPLGRDVRTVRVGFVPELFERERGADAEDEAAREAAATWRRHDLAVLDVLRRLGLEPVPVALPEDLPVDALSLILTAEAATAFDELTRSGRDELLVRQVEQAWPNVFRQGQLIPAVEYLRASRVRRLLMTRMAELFAQVDVYVTPTYGGDNLLLTNLTGHPQVVVPNGFRADGTPTSITFTGRLFGESELLAVAHAYQQATDHHLRRPPL